MVLRNSGIFLAIAALVVSITNLVWATQAQAIISKWLDQLSDYAEHVYAVKVECRNCGQRAKLDTRAIANDVNTCSLSRDIGAIEQRLKSQKCGKRSVRIGFAFELKRPVQFRPLADVYPRVQLVINVKGTRMESYGALAGWDHLDHGSYIMLKLESFRSKDALDERDLDNFRVFLTKQQALLLGNYLIKLSEQSVISRKQKSWLRRRLE